MYVGVDIIIVILLLYYKEGFHMPFEDRQSAKYRFAQGWAVSFAKRNEALFLGRFVDFWEKLLV